MPPKKKVTKGKAKGKKDDEVSVRGVKFSAEKGKDDVFIVKLWALTLSFISPQGLLPGK